MDYAVCVAWWNPEQKGKFLSAWGLTHEPPWLFMQRDANKEGGAKTKNKAVMRAADAGADVVVLLDDDCFPVDREMSLEHFAHCHRQALQPQAVKMFEAVTDPPSRGTPYYDTRINMPVACSMGFWRENGDYCGPRQLAFGATFPMAFKRGPIFGRYFPLCGMNLAFHVHDWLPWCLHMEGVGRFDDIWMGLLWQKAAYARGFCFNLEGPNILHSRQSNVWANLRDEVKRLEHHETAWKRLHAASDAASYRELKAILLEGLTDASGG